MITKVLLLKQTAMIKHWFYELGVDLSQMLGPIEMYSSLEMDVQIGDLKIHAAPAYEKKSDIIRIWTWLKYFFGAIRHVIKSDRRTLIFVVAQPPFLPLLGYLSNLVRKQKYVIWVDDVMPDLLVRSGRLSVNNIIIKVWKWFNNLIFSRAEKIFTIGPCMADLLRQYMTHPNCKVKKAQVIPTWVDVNFIKPIPKKENFFAKNHGQENKITVLYSGNLGLTHDIETMLEAARILQTRSNIHFLIIGGGSKRTIVEKYARELSNVSFLPFQPEENIPYSITTGDIAVVSLDKNFEGISMPSKTYYMMSGGAAIIGISRRPNDLTKVIEACQCGYNIEPGDIDGFCELIVHLAENPKLLEQLRQKSRQAAVEKFSREVNTQIVHDSIFELLYKNNESKQY